MNEQEIIKTAGTIGLLLALEMPTDRKMIKAAERVAKSNRKAFR